MSTITHPAVHGHITESDVLLTVAEIRCRARVYDLECAVHAARQYGDDTVLARTMDNLHEALVALYDAERVAGHELNHTGS